MDSPKKSKGVRPLFDGKSVEVVLQKLETAWAMDCPDTEACSFADISESSLYEFLKRNPSVSERKKRLKDRPFLSARNTVLKAIANGDSALAMRYLERKRRDEFATKQETEHSIAINNTSGLAHIPTEKLKQIRELLNENPDTEAIGGQLSWDTPASPAAAQN